MEPWINYTKEGGFIDMCLNKVTKEYKPYLKRRMKVWKGFNVSSEGLPLFPYCALGNGTTRVPVGKVLTAKAVSIRMPGGKKYKSGFHCFINEKDAMVWKRLNLYAGSSVAVQVEVNEIMYRGLQIGTVGGKKLCPAVIAHKMLLKEADW